MFVIRNIDQSSFGIRWECFFLIFFLLFFVDERDTFPFFLTGDRMVEACMFPHGGKRRLFFGGWMMAAIRMK
jgi:hypothetical protein